MAKIPLKEIKFPDLADTYTIPQVDNTLTTSGDAADAKKTGDEIDALKEDLSTLNTEGTVPTSEQMLSDNYTEDSVPYHFRKTASDNADREELEIVGGSVAWNQLVQNGNFSNGTTDWSVRNGSIVASNGVAVGTVAIAGTYCGLTQGTLNKPASIAGHKYLLMCDVKSPVNGNVALTLGGGDTGKLRACSVNANVWTHCVSFWVKPDSDITYYSAIYVLVIDSLTVGQEIQFKNPLAFDLTQMFGSTIADHIYSLEQATAGAGVALFKSLFPKDYYAYDAGSIQSVSGLSEHRTVGKNILDIDQSEQGGIDASGNLVTGTQLWRGTNYIPVISGETYCVGACNSIYNPTLRIYYYDSEKTFITRIEKTASGSFVIPSGIRYIKWTILFSSAIDAELVKAMQLQIELGSELTSYEPYDGHSYALDDSLTLRGIPTLVDGKIKFDGDIYSPSGKVTRRYTEVRVGDLTVASAFQTGTYSCTKSYTLSTPTTVVAYSEFHGAISTMNKEAAAYWGSSRTDEEDSSKGIFAITSAGLTLRIYDADTSMTSEQFDAKYADMRVVYPLATPTTETADPYVSPQICHYNGTEEFVSTGIVPVGHNTKYPDNLRMKLDNLPWNFASLIAPTESGYTATRNYTTGALLIVNNVLYKATANIANGGTITVGTNVTATTLAEVIAALS